MATGDPIVLGQPPFQQEYGDISYDPVKGYSVNRGYVGLFQNCLDAANLLPRDMRWNITHEEGPIYKLTATTPDLNQDGADTPTPTLTYELISHPVQKSIYEAPF